MSEWRDSRLGDVITLQRGHDLPETERTAGTVPVIGSFGITGYTGEARYSGPGVAIGRSGASIGVATYCPKDYWPLNTCLFVRDYHGNDPRWVYYLLRSMDFSGFNSGSAQPSLNRNYIGDVPVALPPVDEQRAIAATLGALDDKIDSNRRASALSEELVMAQFVRLFSAEPDSDGTPMSDIVDVNPPRRLRTGTPATYVGMSALPQSSAEVTDWEQREAGSGQRFVNGDVLMARITPCLENGKTAVVDMLADGEVGWGSTEYVVLAPKGQVSTPWVYCLARSDPVRSFAIRSMTGTSGRQRFQASSLSTYRIAEPEATALEEFNELSVPFFKSMTQLRNESKALGTLRDVLLPELLSGRVTVDTDGPSCLTPPREGEPQ